MKLRYTPAAREDLRKLRNYLADEFGADVASKTLATLVGNLSELKSFPGLMGELSEKIRRPTEYKYYLCSNLSIAILSVARGCISVVRVLDARSDYAATIFK